MRLLYVEDDYHLGTTTTSLLERSFALDWVTTCRAARDALAISEYDCLIIDLSLPDGDGLELCCDLKENGLTTPILVLTATDGTETKVAAFEGGADDYLTKPYTFAELQARLRALIRRQPHLQPLVMRAGSLSVHTGTRQVTRHGQPISLRRKEYEILELLCQRSGSVVSRNDLYEHIWNEYGQPLSNAIDVHMKNLRDKIDRGFPEPLIETVPGIGYRLRIEEENLP